LGGEFGGMYDFLSLKKPKLVTSIDLQLFAEEDEGRTLEPTEYRIRKAREEGNVPQSQELASSILLLMMFASIVFLGMNILKGIYEVFMIALNTIGSKEINPSTIGKVLFLSGRVVVAFLLPILFISIFVSILSHGLQTRFNIAWKKLTPNLRRVFDIPKNLKRIFFSRDTFFNLAKSIVKIAVAVGITFAIISSEIPNFRKIVFTEPMQATFYVLITSFKTAMFIIVGFLILSFLDYLYQRWSFRKSLRMTPRELKQEIKEFEGDPQIKARIKELEQQMLQRRSLSEVPKADVVITNPTHYAVALKYDPSYMNAPTVIAKGVDALALRIRQIAEENGIEIVENRQLARALYASVDIGEEIPPEYYSIVANILAVVYKKKGVNFSAS
jgi:flagellar biosynthetic protein FlhB